jgi:hypothetical protein
MKAGGFDPMENRVGDTMPKSDDVTKIVQALQGVVTELKKFGVILSTDERKRLLHARKDADSMVQRVHELAGKHNVTIPQISISGMKDDLTLYRMLHPITDLLNAALVLAQDTEGQAESEMWEAYLAYYGVLSSMAERNPELAVELKPVRDFMASTKRRSPPGGGAPGPT